MLEKVKLFLVSLYDAVRLSSLKAKVIAGAIFMSLVILSLVLFIWNNWRIDAEKQAKCEKLGGTYVRGRVTEFCFKDNSLIPFNGTPDKTPGK